MKNRTYLLDSIRIFEESCPSLKELRELKREIYGTAEGKLSQEEFKILMALERKVDSAITFRSNLSKG